jgi:hypothetical protein
MRMTSIQDSLGRFLENSGSEPMNDVAGQLLELIEADEVEPVGTGDPVAAEEIAERLENRLSRLRKRSDAEVEGLSMIEDAVAYLQANDDTKLVPWTFEDSDGIRWFVLADEDDDVVACYTSAPFVEADM